jgi:hypothetical protein
MPTILWDQDGTLSTGTQGSYPLAEVGGPILRVEGGPFSGFAADLDGRQINRALTDGELKALHDAAKIELLE